MAIRPRLRNIELKNTCIVNSYRCLQNVAPRCDNSTRKIREYSIYYSLTTQLEKWETTAYTTSLKVPNTIKAATL